MKPLPAWWPVVVVTGVATVTHSAFAADRPFEDDATLVVAKRLP